MPAPRAELKGRVSLNPRDFTRGLNVIRRQLRTFGRDVGRGLGDAVRNTMRLTAAFVGLASAGVLLGTTKTFDFETMETQFELLFRNTEKARRHVKDLAELSAITPFDVEPFIQTSRLLQTMGGGFLNNKKFITQMGDAAAMAGVDVQQTAEWVGRTFAALKSGGGAGRGARMLLVTGILKPEEQARLKELGTDAANFGQAWDIVLNALSRADGAMERMAKTGNGLFSTLKGLISLGLAESFKAFGDVVKNVMFAINTELQAMRESGTFEKVGEKIGEFGKAAVNTLWRVVKAWKNLDTNTRSQLKSIAKGLAIFGIAWMTGFVQPILSGIARVVIATNLGFGAILAGLTGLGAGLIAFKFGQALEDTFGLSDFVATWTVFLNGIFRAWVSLWSNLGAVAVRKFGAIRDLFTGTNAERLKAMSTLLFGAEIDQAKQFNKEMTQIANEIKAEWKGLGDIDRQGGGAKPGGKLLDNIEKQFSPEQIKKDLAFMAKMLATMMPDAGKKFIAEFKKLGNITFPEMMNPDALDEAGRKARDLLGTIQKITMPIRGRLLGSAFGGGVEGLVSNTFGLNSDVDPASAETAKNTKELVEMEKNKIQERNAFTGPGMTEPLI